MKRITSAISGKITVAFCAMLALLAVGLAAFMTVRAQRPDPVPEAPSARPAFSVTPDRLFPNGIHPVGRAATDEETVVLAAALAEESPGQMGDVVGRVEQYIAERPDSPYTPSLRVDLAMWQRETGRFSRAIENWAEAWAATSAMPDGMGKRIADRSLAHLGRSLASLGRLEQLEALVKAERNRKMSDYEAFDIWMKTIEVTAKMKAHPGRAYRCGTLALEKAAFLLNGRHYGSIRGLPSPETGFSLAQLAVLAEQHQAGFVPAFRSEGADFIVPSVVHWKQNHYATLASEKDGYFYIIDPTFIRPMRMDEDTLVEESSGYFLIPSSIPLPQGWRLVEPAEALQVFGKGWPQVMDENDNENCPPDTCCTGGPGGLGGGPGGPPTFPPNFDIPGFIDQMISDLTGDGSGSRGEMQASTCCGMATWHVQQPNINLIIQDTPMAYDAAYGPDFVLNLTWRQRSESYFLANGGSFFGYGWESDLMAWVDGTSFSNDGSFPMYDSGLEHAGMMVHMGNGGRENIVFQQGQTVSDLHPGSQLRAVRYQYPSDTNIISHVDVFYPDGSSQRFQAYSLSYGSTYYRLEWRKDRAGNSMTFTYDKPSGLSFSNRVTRVTTADGAQFNFSYDSTDVHRIIGITGPNSRSVSFDNSTWMLEGITDTVGITSSFGYDGFWIDELTTPYGTTTFTHDFVTTCDGDHDLSCSGVDRSIIVTEPDNSKQVFLFYDNAYRWEENANGMSGKIPTAFSNSQIPSYATGDPAVQTLDTLRDERNSHHWNRQQAAQLSTLTIANFTAADYRLSHTKHWLRDYLHYHSMNTLGWELPPSADGTTEARPIFYDYAGKDPAWESGPPKHKPYQTFNGTLQRPSVISQRMPDDTTHYRYFEYNAAGMPTKEIERWDQSGTVTYRTNTFKYASGTSNRSVDNLLPTEHVGPTGELVFGRALHTYTDQIGRETNAVGAVTVYDYNSSRQITTLQTHAGLLSTYTYSGNRLQKVVDSVSGVAVRTNSYTWLNGYLRTHTDPRNFTRTFDFDLLGRITQISYPDSTTETFAYSLPNGVGFNSSGSALAILDLVTYKDRLGNYSRQVPNRNRQIEKRIEPSKTSLGSLGTETAIAYCGCGSPDSITLASGTASAETTSYAYNYQGKLLKVTLPNSTAVTNTYDVLGRLLTRKDALMTVTNIYDNLGRLIAKQNGAGLLEGFGYDRSDRILTHTNAAGVITTNHYDGLHRLLVRGYPTGAKEQWSYDTGYAGPAKYTNQVSEITTWTYDASQRRTKEVGTGVYTNTFTYYPANDLNTLTDGKGQVTGWGYNAEGLVSSKTNQSGTQILTWTYNANRRLTTRWTSAKGNTVYGYDGAGNLTNVNYAASTDIRYQYSIHNRLTNMVDAAGTTRFTYNTAGDPLTEDGPFANDTVTWSYHANVPHLRTGLSLSQPTGSWSETYAHDAAQRLSTVTTPAGTFTYTYSTGVGSATTASPQWKKLALFSGSSAYVTNVFDTSSRVTSTGLRNSSHTVLNQHSYTYNNANRHTGQTFPDASTSSYTYDGIGQLKVSDSSVAAEDRGYLYDPAWNLNTRTNNGVTTAFAVNARNELTSVGGASCTYDNNGNIASDGTRTFSYDDENQLTSVYAGTSFRNDFVYDGLGRMKKKLQYIWSSGSWSLYIEIRYAYDGRRVIQERNGSDAPEVAYSRGWDLSGSWENAGGIGGLLARSHGYSSGNWSTHHGYHADGNGNITAMVSTAQAISASYKYDPYGNSLAATGTISGANMYRFSSKELMASPNIYYYGYRFYSPPFQRWLNRDPLGEYADINLYRVNYNSPLNFVDPDGEAALAISLTMPKIPNPMGCAFAAGALIGTGLCEAFPDAMTKPGEMIGNLVCPMIGGKGERGQARKNPSDTKADADKAAGRDRSTGKRDRDPKEGSDPPQPPDPLRGKFPKEPPGKNFPPKDGLPAPVRGGR